MSIPRIKLIVVVTGENIYCGMWVHVQRTTWKFMGNECNCRCPVTMASASLVHEQDRVLDQNRSRHSWQIHCKLGGTGMLLWMRSIGHRRDAPLTGRALAFPHLRREVRYKTSARITPNTWRDSSSMHALPLLQCNRVVCGGCNSWLAVAKKRKEKLRLRTNTLKATSQI